MKVLLVDDHAVVRHGCACLLRAFVPEVHLREACDGEQALQRVQEEIPHLVIMEMSLPGISGLETTRRLRQRLPQLRVLFFSVHDELPLVRQALDAGAIGYLSKGVSLEVLLEAVRRTAAGHAYVEQPLATLLACNPSSAGGADPRLRELTPREFEIFVMLARGLPPRQIAERLCISAKTLSNYQTLVKNKLRIASLAELVRLAIDSGVVRVGLEAPRLH